MGLSRYPARMKTITNALHTLRCVLHFARQALRYVDLFLWALETLNTRRSWRACELLKSDLLLRKGVNVRLLDVDREKCPLRGNCP